MPRRAAAAAAAAGGEARSSACVDVRRSMLTVHNLAII